MRRMRDYIGAARVKIAAIVLLCLTILTISAVAVHYGGSQAYSRAYAEGSLLVIWGDPYLAPNISQGTGSENLTISGYVEERADLPGYYVYTALSLEGSLRAEWPDTSGNAYVLEANFSLVSYQTPYQRITVNPSSNSFAVSYMYFSAALTVNGFTNQTTGTAGMIAAAPGLFTFKGQDRVTSIVLYASAFGYSQFVIRWSEEAQTIDGIQLPAAGEFTQTVRLS